MYQEFAEVYDEFMEDVPYEEWADYIEMLWRHYGQKPSLVLDLACGTGNLTIPLAKRGYDMIGADQSADMLESARRKAEQENCSILFLEQDMREFELYGTVSSVICTCDSLNYLLEEEDLLQVFRLVNNYLDPGGVFLFDMNTEYRFKNIMADHVQTEIYDDAAYIWDNYYYEEEKINEYQITFFVKEKESDLYRRVEEIHHEKAYDPERVKGLLEAAGLEFLDMFDAFTLQPPTPESERICFAAREISKRKES